MAELDEEDIAGSEEKVINKGNNTGSEAKVIWIITAIVLLVSVGIFISSYLDKGNELPETTIIPPTTGPNYVIASDLPDGFSFSSTTTPTPNGGFNVFYSKSDTSYVLSRSGQSIDFMRTRLSSYDDIRKTEFNDLVYITPMWLQIGKVFAYTWWHEDGLLAVYSQEDDEDLITFTKFFLEKFPPTDDVLGQ